MVNQVVVCLICFTFLLATAQYTGGSNGPCSATELSPPYQTAVTALGNTTGASNQASSLCTSRSASSAIWFTIQAENTDLISISTCSVNTTFDTIISVFSGSCSSLQCVYYNDDNICEYNYRASSLIFTPSKAQLYYVSVSGYENAEGIFQISVQNAEATGNTCGAAIEIPPPYTNLNLVGTNYGSYPYSSECSDTSAAVHWYSITPTPGIPLTISTCSKLTDFDTILLIVSDCLNTTCLFYNNNHCSKYHFASTISFVPDSYQYWLGVGGRDGLTGNYKLSLNTTGDLYSSLCETATPIELGSATYGDSSKSLAVYGSPCYPALNSLKTTWFSFHANTSAQLLASTCHSHTSFETQLFIYSAPFGASCTQLNCSPSAHSVCPSTLITDDLDLPASISTKGITTFSTTAGNTYYIVVAGLHAEAAGTFLLTLSSV